MLCHAEHKKLNSHFGVCVSHIEVLLGGQEHGCHSFHVAVMSQTLLAQFETAKTQHTRPRWIRHVEVEEASTGLGSYRPISSDDRSISRVGYFVDCSFGFDDDLERVVG